MIYLKGDMSARYHLRQSLLFLNKNTFLIDLKSLFSQPMCMPLLDPV